jgi:hypothetical protein
MSRRLDHQRANRIRRARLHGSDDEARSDRPDLDDREFLADVWSEYRSTARDRAQERS